MVLCLEMRANEVGIRPKGSNGEHEDPGKGFGLPFSQKMLGIYSGHLFRQRLHRGPRSMLQITTWSTF